MPKFVVSAGGVICNNAGIITGGNVSAGGVICNNAGIITGGNVSAGVFSTSGQGFNVRLGDESYSDVLEVKIEVKSRNGTVYLKREQVPNIVVYGNVERVGTSAGNVTVNGNATKVKNTSGDISITGDVERASSVSGDIIAGKIGSGKSVSGDVRIK